MLKGSLVQRSFCLFVVFSQVCATRWKIAPLFIWNTTGGARVGHSQSLLPFTWGPAMCVCVFLSQFLKGTERLELASLLFVFCAWTFPGVRSSACKLAWNLSKINCVARLVGLRFCPLCMGVYGFTLDFRPSWTWYRVQNLSEVSSRCNEHNRGFCLMMLFVAMWTLFLVCMWIQWFQRTYCC